ncbi:MAG: NADH-quinone oxidoreductase subunit C [Planctomycetota bacterium]
MPISIPMPSTPPLTADTSDILRFLTERFGALETSLFRDQTRIVVPESKSLEVLAFLKDSGFDMLVDLTCVDYLEYRDALRRYGLVYLLASTLTNQRLTLRVFVDDPVMNPHAVLSDGPEAADKPMPTVRSAVPLWAAANWLEREVWDLFGVRFLGHPDLRRLVMPDAFTAHPLRKDYPLQGRGERHNFPVLTRDDG